MFIVSNLLGKPDRRPVCTTATDTPISSYGILEPKFAVGLGFSLKLRLDSDGKEAVLAFKTFQFMLAREARRQEGAEPFVGPLADAGEDIESASQFLEAEGEVHIASHERFFAHRGNSAQSHSAEVENKAKSCATACLGRL